MDHLDHRTQDPRGAAQVARSVAEWANRPDAGRPGPVDCTRTWPFPTQRRPAEDINPLDGGRGDYLDTLNPKARLAYVLEDDHERRNHWVRGTCETCGKKHGTRRCRRRQCPDGVRPWARDCRTVILAGVDILGKDASLELLVITGPGADKLPWDLSQCEKDHPHRHTGPAGCRIQPIRLGFWESACAGNWRRAYQACYRHVARLGLEWPFVGRIDEPQARGCTHHNVLLRPGPGANAVRDWWEANASHYGYGFVNQHRKILRGSVGVAYLTSYLVPKGASSKRAQGTDFTAAAGKATRCRRVWSMSPKLTKRSGVTMASLRRGRQVWAAKQGLCAMPTHGKAVVDWWITDCETGEISHRVFASEDSDDQADNRPKAETG